MFFYAAVQNENYLEPCDWALKWSLVNHFGVDDARYWGAGLGADATRPGSSKEM
jgi:hypothetical protein